MAVNWSRLAWTIGLAALGLLAFFIYVEYMQRYRANSDLVEKKTRRTAQAQQPKAKPTPSRRLPRSSRKYRKRR